MPALSFKKGFTTPILSLIKQGTIRNQRKRPIVPGDKLYLFQEQRNPKNSKKLGEATCSSVAQITINHNAIIIHDRPALLSFKGTPGKATLAGTKRPRFIETPKELNDFAIGDGFLDWEGMRRWWVLTHKNLPWTGVWIQWKEFKPTRHE